MHIRLDRESISHLDSPTRSNTSERSESYDECTSIDVSSSGLFAFPHPRLFPSCTNIDISDNELSRLSSILPFSKRLTHLNATRNKINNVSDIHKFTSLQVLNLSSNQITEIAHFHGSLTLLDLSHNHLTQIPPLASLNLLETLNLSGNDIRDLSSSSLLLPTSIKFMNLSSNKIDLLSSLYHLTCLSQLHSLCISSNPCISPSLFNHRPFIFALFYTSLLEADGTVLLEEEILVGERMLQDKLNKLKRGGYEKESELREYLTVLSPPASSSVINTSFDARMTKVLEKRREHESSLLCDSSFTESQSLSLHSPYSNWTRAVLNDKENQSPSQSEHLSTSTVTPTSNGMLVERVIVRSLFEKEERKETKTPPIPKPRMSCDKRMKMAALTIQIWWRYTMKRRRRRIEETRGEGTKDDQEKKRMRNQIEALTNSANMQAECTEKLVETVNELKERVAALESLVTPIPPSNLRMDHSNGVNRLVWNAPPPLDVYEVYVNGRLEGNVSGRASSVILSNIPHSSTIQLKSVRGSLTSVFSKSVLSD